MLDSDEKGLGMQAKVLNEEEEYVGGDLLGESVN